MGNSLCRCYCCCFKCESTPHACRMDFCCLHVGGGHLGSGSHPNDVGETVIRKEKANIDLCCCGLKINDVDMVGHPATRPPATGAAGNAATTKPEGMAPMPQNTYNPPPPAGYGDVNTGAPPAGYGTGKTGAPPASTGMMNTGAQQTAGTSSAGTASEQPVMGYPAVQKKVVD